MFSLTDYFNLSFFVCSISNWNHFNMFNLFQITWSTTVASKILPTFQNCRWYSCLLLIYYDYLISFFRFLSATLGNLVLTMIPNSIRWINVFDSLEKNIWNSLQQILSILSIVLWNLSQTYFEIRTLRHLRKSKLGTVSCKAIISASPKIFWKCGTGSR